MNSKKDEVLQCVKTYIDENHISPSFREIGKMTGIQSLSTVHRYLHQLEYEGKILMTEGRNRSIVLLEGKQRNLLEIPILKRFQPNLFLSNNIDGFVRFYFDKPPEEILFAVRVEKENDLLQYQKGDIVVAVKTDSDVNGVSVYVDENNHFAFRKETFVKENTIGKVIAMIRNYNGKV
mgnify:CR=1 FL=1